MPASLQVTDCVMSSALWPQAEPLAPQTAADPTISLSIKAVLRIQITRDLSSDVWMPKAKLICHAVFSDRSTALLLHYFDKLSDLAALLCTSVCRFISQGNVGQSFNSNVSHVKLEMILLSYEQMHIQDGSYKRSRTPNSLKEAYKWL